MGNTIAYNVKSCRVKRTIINFNEEIFKGLKISNSPRRNFGTAYEYVEQL